MPVAHRMSDIDGIVILYRETGPLGAPVVLLTHGHPSSSIQFRYVLPALDSGSHDGMMGNHGLHIRHIINSGYSIKRTEIRTDKATTVVLVPPRY